MPAGVIIHTGDFKIDLSPPDNKPFDLHKFAEYGKRGVLLLLSDSTNVDRAGFTPSERSVRPGLEELVRNADRRVVVSAFFVFDVTLAGDGARHCRPPWGGKWVWLGRSMLSTTEIAHSLGILQIPDSILLRPQDIMLNQPDKTLALISGTQGEPMSALSRASCDGHKSLRIEKGDTVVLSSRIIPGNEKPIMRVINHLARRNANVYFGNRTPHIHVSGHGASEELKIILNLVRPKYFVPLHGEYWQLRKHIELASGLKDQGLEQCFLLETGETLVFDSKGGLGRATASTWAACSNT
jgi:ribonuclease J